MLKVTHPLAGLTVDREAGGYGPPGERDPEHVRTDVRDGYVSREAAERDYDVVLDDALAVDVAATERLRASRPVR